MMSRLSSRGKMRASRPAASAMRTSTGMPRKTSGHQSSPMISTLAGPFGFAARARNRAAYSSETERFVVVVLELRLVALDVPQVLFPGHSGREPLRRDYALLRGHGFLPAPALASCQRASFVSISACFRSMPRSAIILSIVSKRRVKLVQVPPEGVLGVDVQVAGQAGQSEGGVSQLIALVFGRLGLSQLLEFLFQCLPDLRLAFPRETGPRSPALDRLRVGEAGQGPRDAGERWTGAALLALEVVPLLNDGRRRLGDRCGEDVGVPPHQLAGKGVDHVRHLEVAALFGELDVDQHLERAGRPAPRRSARCRPRPARRALPRPLR